MAQPRSDVRVLSARPDSTAGRRVLYLRTPENERVFTFPRIPIILLWSRSHVGKWLREDFHVQVEKQGCETPKWKGKSGSDKRMIIRAKNFALACVGGRVFVLLSFPRPVAVCSQFPPPMNGKGLVATEASHSPALGQRFLILQSMRRVAGMPAN